MEFMIATASSMVAYSILAQWRGMFALTEELLWGLSLRIRPSWPGVDISSEGKRRTVGI